MHEPHWTPRHVKRMLSAPPYYVGPTVAELPDPFRRALLVMRTIACTYSRESGWSARTAGGALRMLSRSRGSSLLRSQIRCSRGAIGTDKARPSPGFGNCRMDGCCSANSERTRSSMRKLTAAEYARPASSPSRLQNARRKLSFRRTALSERPARARYASMSLTSLGRLLSAASIHTQTSVHEVPGGGGSTSGFRCALGPRGPGRAAIAASASA
mmetsp:Transcript_1371/g.2837  ORF Transcript_1371/g.2837 Transcript_1371/m.2837 type:complete len:214 (+) Transcript_1371:40-681(+)